MISVFVDLVTNAKISIGIAQVFLGYLAKI